MFDFDAVFRRGLSYQDFLQQFATPQQQTRWDDTLQSVMLTPDQRELVGGFQRAMHVLCMSGAWCGDCVRQCPHMQRIAEASGKIQLRFVDRDAEPELRDALRICGGQRVPVVVFMAEDGEFCGIYGDRTISTYRRMAIEQLGPACPTGIGAVDPSINQAVVSDWLMEFERVQLMLRLSSRLRQKHND